MAAVLFALALLGVAFPSPIETPGTPQHLAVTLHDCGYTFDDTVYAETSAKDSSLDVIVRETSYDRVGRWIADDLYLAPADGEGVSDIVRPPRHDRPARIGCALDALDVDGGLETASEIGPQMFGDIARCTAAHNVVDDGGPDGTIESVSIGPTWLGVTFHAYVNMFFPQAYGKLHDEPYTLYVDDRKMQTLKANGMSERLHFLAPYDPSKSHKIAVGNPGFMNPTDVWIVCLNPVKR